MSVINSIDEWNVASEKWPSRTPQKTAIVIDLYRLEELCREYVAECVPNVNDRLAMQLRLSAFLSWLRKRQEKMT